MGHWGQKEELKKALHPLSCLGQVVDSNENIKVPACNLLPQLLLRALGLISQCQAWEFHLFSFLDVWISVFQGFLSGCSMHSSLLCGVRANACVCLCACMLAFL